MFEGIRKRWAEARVDVARKEVEDILLRYNEDILLRYNQADSNSRYFVSSAFGSVLGELEEQFGPASEWTDERKKSFAKEIMTSSRKELAAAGSGVIVQAGRISAYGGALLSLYLELQTLPGSLAKATVESIDKWRASVE